MEYPTNYNYAGNPWSGSAFMNNQVLTPGFDSEFEFSQLLNFSPAVGNSQNAMPNMPVNMQPTIQNMPGEFVDDSEFPFPTLPESTSLPTSASGNTLAPADLSITSIPTHGYAVAGESQSVDPQVHDGVKRQTHDETTQSAGQKRTKPNTDAGEEPKPKRRRGARKKIRTAEELAKKRENHLQRNRDAAQKCRQKKKQTEAEKKEQMVRERQDNHIAWNNIARVEEELESFRNLAFDIESSCDSDDHKAIARESLNKVSILVAQLQDRVDMCNQRRAGISEGLVMTRSFTGYVQQDSIQNGPESVQDAHSPAMSAQTSTYLPGHGRTNSHATSTVSVGDLPSAQRNGMGSRPMSRDMSYSENPHKINTDFANGANMSRNGSTPGNSDSAIGSNSPPEGVKKDMAIDDEGIGNPIYRNNEPLPSLDAGLDFAYLAQVQFSGQEQVN